MTVTAPEPIFTRIVDGASAVAWLNGALTMRARVMTMLMSMGERDLALTVGRMDLPTRDAATGAAASQENV